MAKLKKLVKLETAFATYMLDEQIGAGGAGTVYAGRDTANALIAAKVLSKEAASTDKRKRFKNEIAFLIKCAHPRVVQVVDHGFSTDAGVTGPFYIMRRYSGSLRDLLKRGVSPDEVLPLYLQLLDGVEAAHFLGAVHRDLKPENILWEAHGNSLAVADFGVAGLGPDLAATVVDTKPERRLANFTYAAPEQRITGQPVTAAADIYALGLMLNEMFTGAVAHGQGYKTIGSAAPKFAYLDEIVASMLAQSPAARPASIAEVKGRIEFLGEQELTRQKISKIDDTVVPIGEVDNPLARNAPCVVSAEYRDGWVIICLDRPVNDDWVDVLRHRLGNYTSIVPPERFQFSNRTVTVAAESHVAQQVVELFKQWLPQATQVLNARLQHQLAREKEERGARLRQERAREAERLRMNRVLRV